MQKQVYETPDLITFGNIEALTAGQSQFSPRCFDDSRCTGSGHTSQKPPSTYNGYKKWNWSWWGWH